MESEITISLFSATISVGRIHRFERIYQHGRSCERFEDCNAREPVKISHGVSDAEYLRRCSPPTVNIAGSRIREYLVARNRALEDERNVPDKRIPPFRGANNSRSIIHVYRWPTTAGCPVGFVSRVEKEEDRNYGYKLIHRLVSRLVNDFRVTVNYRMEISVH